MFTSKRLALVFGSLSTLFVLVHVPPAPADFIIAEATGGAASQITQDTRAKHGVVKGPTGNFFRSSQVFNSNANPNTSSSTPPNSAAYPNPPVGTSSKTVSNQGNVYRSRGVGRIDFQPGSWDSRASIAEVVRLAAAPKGAGEAAYAAAHVSDPAEYTATFDLSFTPEILISLALSDLQLTAISTESLESSYASISGTYETDLLEDGFLFNFLWEASSDSLDESFFTFTSNPILGLDDGALETLFLSLVSSTSGVHKLTGDWLVEISIFPTLAAGQDTLVYTIGGSTNHYAQALTIPEPSTLSLCAYGAMCGAFALAASKARKRAA